MAKDLTKYRIQGSNKFLPKSRTVLACLKQFFKDVNVAHQHPNTNWPDEIQGNAGLIKKIEDVENPRYYFMDDVLTDSQGNKYVVCNQWGAGNFERFISHAAKMGYPLEHQNNVKNDVPVENETQVNTFSGNNNSSATVAGSPGWGVAEAIGFVIRQTIFADGKAEDEEINWMYTAFDEFDDLNIDLRNSWDNVDDQAQIYESMDMHDKLFLNSIKYLKLNTGNEIKETLINILIAICVEDKFLHNSEYQILLHVISSFFPGQAENIIESLRDEGVEIEE